MPIPILTYHSIDDTGSVVSTSPMLFEQHVSAIVNAGCRGVSLRMAIDERSKSGTWPADAVVISFDDAFLNVFERAFQILKEHNCTATVFVISDYIASSNDWETPPDGLGRQQTMEAEHLKALVDAGWEVGSHTKTHPDLRLLPDDSLSVEIAGSRSELEHRFGVEVTSFAYPYGRYDRRAVDIVKREYRAACTTELRRASENSLHELPRVDSFYLRNERTMQQLVAGDLDRYLTLRRLGRRIRSWRPNKKLAVRT